MSSWLYADYISVKEDFIPVYTMEEDSLRRGAWKAFIPHRPMQHLLDEVMKSIERGPDPKSIWLHGAYGTGKTFGVFTVKHLLEEPVEEVETYLAKYDSMLSHMAGRLRALRQKHHPLVVYTSSAAHINSHLDLLTELQSCVERSLLEKGLRLPTGVSLVQEMLSKLRDTSSVFNWRKAFEKYHALFGSYEPGDYELVAKDLETIAHSPEPARAGIRNQLVRSIYEVFQKEGIVIASDAERFKKWVQEVLDVNSDRIDSIIFIWDEFTDYFVRNERFGWLQEIAHLSKKTPFYLLLVTHRNIDQLVRNRTTAEDYTRLSERFTTVTFEMADVTAYQLMANAIVPSPDNEEDWEDRKEALWPKIRTAVNALTTAFQEHASATVFKDLLPLHPFSAYLLSLISRQFTSSERTLFRFLTDQRDDAFGGFIRKHPSQGTYLYTADRLWDYFFDSTSDEIAPGIRDLVSHYQMHSEHLSPSARAVLRAAMLTMALSRQIGGDSMSVVTPRLSYLENLFAGTDINVRAEFDNLSTIGLLNPYSLGGSEDKGFMLPVAGIDETRLRNIVGELKIEKRFPKLAEPDGPIGSRIIESLGFRDQPEAQHMRIRTASYEELARAKERIVPSHRPYQIAVVLVLVQDEQQLDRALSLCNSLSSMVDDAMFATIDALFTTKDYERWLDLMAHARYCESIGDQKNKQFYSERAADVIHVWLKSALSYHCQGFFRGQQTGFSGVAGFKLYFASLLNQVFPERPEREFQTNTLYRTSGYGAAMARYALGVDKPRAPYVEVLDMFEARGYLSGTGFDRLPTSNISLMKKVIQDEFSVGNSANIAKIWATLQEPPFGLFPCGMSVFLMALLLREYVDGYYLFDGVNSHKLNPDRLADVVQAVVKKGSTNFVIRRVSRAEEILCETIGDVFGLDGTVAAYYKETRKHVRVRLIKLGYPLWALLHLQEVSDNEDLLRAISSLNQFVESIDENDGLEIEERDADLMCHALLGRKESLSQMLKSNRALKEGFARFLAETSPCLVSLVAKLGLSEDELKDLLRNQLNEDPWLWTTEKVLAALPEVRSELRLVSALNTLISYELKDLELSIDYLRNRWLTTNLPLCVFQETADDPVKDCLIRISEMMSQGRKYPQKDVLSSLIEAHYQQIREHVSEPITALIKCCQDLLGQDLLHDDAAKILGEMDSSYRSADLSRIKLLLTTRLGALVRSKVLTQVKHLWYRLTGARTPTEWSERHLVPISWVFNSASDGEFLASMKVVDQLSEQQLKACLDYMQVHSERFVQLRDDRYVDSRFLAEAAQEFAEVSRRADISSLKEFLKSHVSVKPELWPSMPSEVRKQVRKWAEEVYMDGVYDYVLHLIDDIPEDSLRGFLKDLSRDPAIGEGLIRLSSVKRS